MSPRNGPGSANGPDAEPGPETQGAFAAMFEEHAAYVFDYCSRLAGDEADAANATEAAIVAARSLLIDPDRLRAWLFALARQEVLAQIQAPDQEQEAEILDLVHRHGIRPQDLSVVLGVSPERAQAMLASAEAEVDWLGDGPEPQGAVPVAVGAGAAGQPAVFARGRRRLRNSAVLVAAAGSAAAGIIYLGGSPSGQAGTHGQKPAANPSAAAVVFSPAKAPPRQVKSASKRHQHLVSKRASAPFPAQPVGGAVPVTATSTPVARRPTRTPVLTPPPRPSRTPQPSKSPSSPPPTTTPTPTPTPTPTSPSP